MAHAAPVVDETVYKRCGSRIKTQDLTAKPCAVWSW
jgi:hypothetical protein